MIEIANIYDEFRLPIDFCKVKTNTAENLYDDLELLKNKNSYDYKTNDEKEVEGNIEGNHKNGEPEEKLEEILEGTLSQLINMRKKYKEGDRTLTLEEIKERETIAKNKLQKILKKKITETFFGSQKGGDSSEKDSHKNQKQCDIDNDIDVYDGETTKYSLYNTLLKPESTIGEACLLPWSRQYTTDVGFLRDSQKIYESFDNIETKPELLEKTWEMWRGIKNDTSFLHKYNYIDISFFKWMNKSSQLLLILSIYNMSSPVLNLLSPLVIFIMPFIIMKIMKVEINWENYKDILKREMKKKGIGRMITSLKDASWNKRIYIFFCIFMYFFNIYQNVQSCIHFRRNMIKMNDNYNTLRDFCDYTIFNMTQFLEKSEKYESYSIFNEKLTYNLNKIKKFNATIQNICTKKLSIKTVKELGKIMKNLYNLYDCENIEKLMLFSIGFNGYYETIRGLHENISDGHINKIKYKLPSNKSTKSTKRKKKPVLKMKKMYHPSIQLQNKDCKIIKNNIKLSKNKIITGPNAAGKTTFLKAVTVNLLISQQFGFGYYESGKLTPFDHIHCYINIPDTSSRDSLFQAEARRCVKILNHIKQTPDETHFCIFDELFSGTNPYEAISSAHAYLSFIGNNENVKFLLTTHFIKLCDLFKKHKFVENVNMETKIVKRKPQYTYKMVKGISKTKGGIFVLKDLEYPEEILEDVEQNIATMD